MNNIEEDIYNLFIKKYENGKTVCKALNLTVYSSGIINTTKKGYDGGQGCGAGVSA